MFPEVTQWRRCSAEPIKHAVRLVPALRDEQGTSAGIVSRVVLNWGSGVASLRPRLRQED